MQLDELTSRDEQLDALADALPQRAGALVRLFFANSVMATISRTEASVLKALERAPARITQLACAERISQPGITLVVNRLQERGWVARDADPSDGRAVLVSLTDAGREMVARQREAYRELVRDGLAALDDEDVSVLSRAVELLDELIERLSERALSAPVPPIETDTRRTR
jgi:DNA-binding MarR family transcriptional regulator